MHLSAALAFSCHPEQWRTCPKWKLSHHKLLLPTLRQIQKQLLYRKSPYNNSSDDDIEHFYTTLRYTIENIPAQNFLLIPGDFNAKLGPDDAKFTFHSKTNRNGEHLVDLIEEINLCPANNRFMKSSN